MLIFKVVWFLLVAGDRPEAIISALHKMNHQKTAKDEPNGVASSEEEDLGGIELIEFHPTFTYPIFGTQERIFGYKGLNIDVSNWQI